MNNGSELFYKGKEVALFYLRAGYDPSCYVTDPKSDEMDPQSWSNRLLIEKSRSIKSPPVNYHLLTNKRFQGMLRVESTAQNNPQTINCCETYVNFSGIFKEGGSGKIYNQRRS